jgi:nucleotide sugar dehydrogenase
MKLYEKILKGEEKIALVGLGYVGMPIAVEFSKHVKVIGFDINKKKIELYQKGIDPTKEVGDEEIQKSSVEWTSDETKLKEAKFIIVAVPTPVNADTTPDLTPVESSSQIVGRNLTKGSIVVYESTVYPGVTEETCIPILEKESGLICGVDFKVGYSPERINPGDKVHRLTTIKKIVSGMDAESLDEIAHIYEIVVAAGVHRAETIKVAEAAKVIENSQRDINIAFMNELSMIFNRLGIDTQDVLRAASTKWNFLNFKPGLVGGHCIGIDPYYITYRADQFGYHSKIILAGRRVNDNMGKYIADETIKLMIDAEVNVKKARVGILGITFKEDCPDARNSKVDDVIKELNSYGIEPMIYDPVADKADAEKFYNIKLHLLEDLKELDCVMIAVAHKEFMNLSNEQINAMFKDIPMHKKIIVDVKGIKDRKEMLELGYKYWRL